MYGVSCVCLCFGLEFFFFSFLLFLYCYYLLKNAVQEQLKLFMNFCQIFHITSAMKIAVVVLKQLLISRFNCC